MTSKVTNDTSLVWNGQELVSAAQYQQQRHRLRTWVHLWHRLKRWMFYTR